jgi:mRNA-degrading endonuclease RelE of RelBE toxin-antitoxin system
MTFVKVKNIEEAIVFFNYKPRRKAYMTMIRIGNFGILYMVDDERIFIDIIDFRNPTKKKVKVNESLEQEYDSYKIYSYLIVKKSKIVHYNEYEDHIDVESYEKIYDLDKEIVFETEYYKLAFNKDTFKIEFPEDYKIINHAKSR